MNSDYFSRTNMTMNLREHLVRHTKLSNSIGYELLLMLVLPLTKSNIGFIFFIITIFSLVGTVITLLVYRNRIEKMFGKPARRFFFKFNKNSKKSSSEGFYRINALSQPNYRSLSDTAYNPYNPGNIYGS